MISLLKSALANCGGISFRSRRFAGRLASPVGSRERIEIMHALIMPNGVRKTTNTARNTSTIERIVQQHGRVLPPAATVIDVGCSAGVDSVSTLACLRKNRQVARYVLADLYTAVLVDPASGMVYDEAGAPLQRRIAGGFFSFNFSYNYGWQRVLHLPYVALARFLREAAPKPGGGLKKVILMTDELLEDGVPVAPFEVRTLDVFEAPKEEERFSLVICLHLLVKRYFSAERIEFGIGNLKRYVADNGILIVGDCESPRVFVRENGVFREEALSSSSEVAANCRVKATAR